MTGPLAGFRVLDCAEGMAGPMAALYLADFGADVIKVETPAGDPARTSPGFPFWNRNKRGITLDLEIPSDRDEFLDLLAGADGCVFSWPLGRLRTLGLAPDTLTARFPSLVYLHTPPYVPDGPASELPESLGLLCAATGVAQFQYSNEPVPVDPVVPHVLAMQGIWGAGAMSAAFFERLNSGLGQAVTVGGLQGVLAAAGGLFTQAEGANPGRPLGGPGGKLPNYRLYQCADGEWFFLGAFTPAFRVSAFGVLGILDLLLTDPRIDGELAAVGLPRNLGWSGDLVASVIRTRPRAQWLHDLRAAGVPCEPVQTRAEWLAHPQLAAMGVLATLDDPERGPVTMPGITFDLPASPGSVRFRAPTHGEHQGCIERHDLPRPPASTPGTRAGPLAGVRVLDLGAIIAGPYIGTLLADLGADVVKVEPPSGDNLRGSGITFVGYNLGKRSAALDLQQPAGRAAFLQLVRTADVVVDNYRPGVLERLGVDHASLRAVNPAVVSVSITGYGNDGPLGGRPGFDPLLQAMSGMMRAQGGEGPPVFYTVAVHDVGSAATAALGAILALLHRRRTGQGQRVQTSLAAVSLIMQPAEMVQYHGRPESPSGGTDFPGPSALDRHYRAQDGWLRLQATAAGDVARLAAAGLLPAGTNDDATTRAFLATSLAAMTRADALSALTVAGVLAVPSRDVAELPDVSEFTANAALQLAQFRAGDRIWTAGNYARFSRTERTGAKQTPGLGEHTRAVLAEAGFAATATGDLLAARIAYQGSPFTLQLGAPSA